MEANTDDSAIVLAVVQVSHATQVVYSAVCMRADQFDFA